MSQTSPSAQQQSPALPGGSDSQDLGGGGIEAQRGAPSLLCCRQSHHQCLPSPDGKQAIRKFLLRHRNQKPNTTQEGENIINLS